MDLGQIIHIYSRLILGAATVFLVIMLWSKTRDTAWLLMIIGIIAAYIETVCSILNALGIAPEYSLLTGSASLPMIILGILRMLFIITALLVMVMRRKL